ncbi:MAG: RNA 2',3'-cyclic phosphodiesterase, partial [Jatrophihabitantaceae bacterium]
MALRMFVAVTPPDEVVEHLADYLEPRQDAPGSLRWTLPEQWHLTLAFMAAVPDHALDALTDQLASLVADRSSFSLQLQGAGTFPNPAAAKVLWAGVAGEVDVLQRLAVATRAAVA